MRSSLFAFFMELMVHPNWVSGRNLQIHWNKSNEMVCQAVKIAIPLDFIQPNGRFLVRRQTSSGITPMEWTLGHRNVELFSILVAYTKQFQDKKEGQYEIC